MFVGKSEEYQCPVIFPEEGDDVEQIIKACREEGAIFHEEGPSDELFVVQLRPNIGPELWTERALRESR